jgi:hypothetical protein
MKLYTVTLKDGKPEMKNFIYVGPSLRLNGVEGKPGSECIIKLSGGNYLNHECFLFEETKQDDPKDFPYGSYTDEFNPKPYKVFKFCQEAESNVSGILVVMYIPQQLTPTIKENPQFQILSCMSCEPYTKKDNYDTELIAIFSDDHENFMKVF